MRKLIAALLLGSFLCGTASAQSLLNTNNWYGSASRDRQSDMRECSARAIRVMRDSYDPAGEREFEKCLREKNYIYLTPEDAASMKKK